jgi:signal peptidase I
MNPDPQSTNPIIKFWKFLKEDSWQSWVVSLILIIIIIKLIVFPLISLITGSTLPIVVIESCSMYHATEFDSWWNSNGGWYDGYKNITKEEFQSYHFKNGLNKGDIIIVTSPKRVSKGEIIIFQPNEAAIARYPIIHRIIATNPIGTKGDNNNDQLKAFGAGYNNPVQVDETNINQDQLIGKATIRIPYLGWIKLIFFEPLKPASQRGLCKSN